MADLYRSKVEELAAAPQREDTRLQASEMRRGLIESMVLTPDDGPADLSAGARRAKAEAGPHGRARNPNEPRLRIELRGNLAAMLTAAQQTKRSPDTGDLLVPIQLVAGAGFEPATFGL
jgi:hypothetical protein